MYYDDRNGIWNDGIYWVIQEEANKLRSEGYRIVLLHNMNAHVGNVPGTGIIGNNDDVNRSGEILVLP